jgi:hypothetical protein
MSQTEFPITRLRAAIVAIVPLVLLIGFFYHPYFSPVTDPGEIAEAAAADTTRWGIAHITIGVGYALMSLAFLAIRSYLRDAGEDRWSAPALPCVIVGGTLFTALIGMEFAPLAAIESGADAEAAQDELRPWFLPVLLTGAISYAFGFAIAIVRGGLPRPELARFVAAALVVMAVVRFVPVAVAPYVLSVAGVMALWPLAYQIWISPAAPPEPHPQLTAAG